MSLLDTLGVWKRATDARKLSCNLLRSLVMTNDLHFLSIAQAAELIRTRKLSPVELAQAYLRRIADFDPQLRAYIAVAAELAMKQARQAEQEIANGKYRAPLHCIPFGLKDIYNTKGILTTGHSRVCIDNIPGEDATTTRKLYEAGAVLLGKLATHEFAHGGPSFDLPWCGRRRVIHGTSNTSQDAQLLAKIKRVHAV